VRRNYSICEPVSSGRLRIGIKLLPGGTFSTYAMEQLQVGDVLEIMTPTGRFFTELDPADAKHYVAIAGGSGITPILSILATVLEEEEKSRCTLLYGNRTWDSIMFRDELSALQRRHPDRLRIRHFLSDEPADSPILADREVVAGQLTPERLAGLFEEFVPPKDADEWFLCGPQPMALAALPGRSMRHLPSQGLQRQRGDGGQPRPGRRRDRRRLRADLPSAADHFHRRRELRHVTFGIEP
jgi:ring-1,2-phenylacetyl-CoA epoxidase subunit PaaE